MFHGGFQRVVRVVAHNGRQAGQLERGGRGKRFIGAGEGEHLGQMGIETHFAKSLGDLRAVKIGEFHALQIEVELHIAHDGRHAAARVRVFLMLGKVLQLLALELVEVVVDAVDATIVLQKLRGGFIANAGHAGNVVGRIALQAQEVGELRRRHAIALLNLGRAVNRDIGDALFRGNHVRAIGHELVDVFIAAHKQGFVSQLFVAGRHRAQHVVAFPTLHANNGHVHRFEQMLDNGELRLELGVHRRALGFVLLERLHAECRTSSIERAYHSIGTCHFVEFQEHGQKAERGIRGRAIGRVHRGRHRVVCAMHERIAVDYGDFLWHNTSFETNFGCLCRARWRHGVVLHKV